MVGRSVWRVHSSLAHIRSASLRPRVALEDMIIEHHVRHAHAAPVRPRGAVAHVGPDDQHLQRLDFERDHFFVSFL